MTQRILLRVVHLEDDRRDAELVQLILVAEGIECDLKPAQTRADFLAALEEGVDLVLADYSLPSFDGMSALSMVRERHPELPFIFVTGTLGEEVAVESLKKGATDYVLKQRLSRLVPSVRRALHEAEERSQRKRAEEDLQRSQDRLTETGKELRIAHQENQELLSAIPSIMVALDANGIVTKWNHKAGSTFGISGADVVGKPLRDCGIQWNSSKVLNEISDALTTDRRTHLGDVRYTRPDGKEGILGISINPIKREEEKSPGFLLFGADITERRILEAQLRQAQKLESVGQLAAGVAHEINTPTQYVGDNIRFLQESFGDLRKLLKKYSDLLEANQTGATRSDLVTVVECTIKEINLEYLIEEIPQAIQQSLEGIERVTNILRSMKDFAHPGSAEKVSVDLNRAIESTVTVARNEWKYVAEVVMDLDPNLPKVTCLLGEINQVILNLIINAAHTISDVVEQNGGKKGTITIKTCQDGDWVEIRISDTGTGIPEAIRSKIFDPFFTTKEVGKGTGQGLAISHSVLVEKHGGTITFDTEVGRGTTFFIRLPANSISVSGETREACASSSPLFQTLQ